MIGKFQYIKNNLNKLFQNSLQIFGVTPQEALSLLELVTSTMRILETGSRTNQNPATTIIITSKLAQSETLWRLRTWIQIETARALWKWAFPYKNITFNSFIFFSLWWYNIPNPSFDLLFFLQFSRGLYRNETKSLLQYNLKWELQIPQLKWYSWYIKNPSSEIMTADQVPMQR